MQRWLERSPSHLLLLAGAVQLLQQRRSKLVPVDGKAPHADFVTMSKGTGRGRKSAPLYAQPSHVTHSAEDLHHVAQFPPAVVDAVRALLLCNPQVKAARPTMLNPNRYPGGKFPPGTTRGDVSAFLSGLRIYTDTLGNECYAVPPPVAVAKQRVTEASASASKPGGPQLPSDAAANPFAEVAAGEPAPKPLVKISTIHAALLRRLPPDGDWRRLDFLLPTLDPDEEATIRRLWGRAYRFFLDYPQDFELDERKIQVRRRIPDPQWRSKEE